MRAAGGGGGGGDGGTKYIVWEPYITRSIDQESWDGIINSAMLGRNMLQIN